MRGMVAAAVVCVGLTASAACAAQPERAARPVSGRGKSSADTSRPKGAPVRAVVEDIYGVTMEIEQPRLHLEESGLFSAGKSKPLEKLVVWKGAHQILIDPARIAAIERVEGSKPTGGLMPVRVKLRDGESVEGKVGQDLELRGRTRYGGYVVRVERCRRITFRY